MKLGKKNKKDSRHPDWLFFCPPGSQKTIFYLRVALVCRFHFNNHVAFSHQELHQKVVCEQEEFLAFTKAEAAAHPEKYQHLHPDIQHFMEVSTQCNISLSGFLHIDSVYMLHMPINVRHTQEPVIPPISMQIYKA